MPDAIINLIGMASVDGCEKQPDLAYQLNAGCLENIVDWVIARNGGPLIHISTDHVYDSKGLNVEDNVVLRNMYAMTKRCAELFAQRTNGVVLRTNFFGVSECKERVSFSDWLVSCMLEGKKTNLFNDVYFSPLTMQNFSELIRMILEKPISGVYNVGSINGMSKRDFAFCLAKHLGLNTSNFTESSILETPFKERPRFMEMDCNLFQNTYKISLPYVRATNTNTHYVRATNTNTQTKRIEKVN
jgi:dTDP-4-dehydrorhamnose reductase